MKDSSQSGAALLSMTGFGSASRSDGGLQIDLELKSINSRFLDLSFRLPREYSAFEMECREVLSGRLSRGRVELFIGRRSLQAESGRFVLNRALFNSWIETYTGLCGQYSQNAQISPEIIRDVLQRREVLEASEHAIDIAREKSLVMEALNEALTALIGMRQAEGAKLVADSNEGLARLAQLLGEMRASAAAAPARVRERLLERLAAISSETKLDPARLAEESLLIAQRVDVNEELVRLDSHIERFAEGLKQAGSGKRLDFVLQECGREINTIGSKVQDSAFQGMVVESKLIIERLREQVQNIE